MIIKSLQYIFGYSSFKNDSYKIIDSLGIRNEDKEMIKKRYVNTVLEAEKDIFWVKKIYALLSFWVTIGGVIIASLILLKEYSFIDSYGKRVLFWFSWIFPLTISMANKTIGLFSLDKKYIMNSAYVEKLKTEGWQYFILSGKYSEFLNHNDGFKKFGSRIERLIINTVSQNLEIDDDKSDKLFSSIATDNIYPDIQRKESEVKININDLNELNNLSKDNKKESNLKIDVIDEKKDTKDSL